MNNRNHQEADGRNSPQATRTAFSASGGSFFIPVVTPTSSAAERESPHSSYATAHSSGTVTPKVVKLDVGGFKFTTSRTTLCSVPGSHLEAMFSGRHSMEELQTEDGSYFIDRDGR